MQRFDEYWFSHGFDREGLSPDHLAEWLVMSESEGAGSLTKTKHFTTITTLKRQQRIFTRRTRQSIR